MLDSALRELPRMFSYALAPKNLILAVDQNDADVWAKAFTIEHDCYSSKLNWVHFFTICP
jgi:hypothetical protein